MTPTPGPYNYIEMVDRLFERACEHEGIDPDAEIVIFSDDNPYAKKYKAVYDSDKYDNAKAQLEDDNE